MCLPNNEISRGLTVREKKLRTWIDASAQTSRHVLVGKDAEGFETVGVAGVGI